MPALEALYMSVSAKYSCIDRILARPHLRDLYIAPAVNDPDLEKKTARPGQRLCVRRAHSRADDGTILLNGYGYDLLPY